MVFLYRLSSGEVLGFSPNDNPWGGMDPAYYAVVFDPSTPNGIDLTIPKRWDGAVLRNATPVEIVGFATFTATDVNLQHRNQAIDRLQNDVVLRKVLQAIVGLTVQQINVVRQNPTTVFAALTQQQAVSAIVSAIQNGTFD